MPRTKKDPMLVGYHFSYAQEKNPYDFITDPVTGCRPTQKSPPSGHILHNLRFGISAATLPPLEIWKQGDWLNGMDESLFASQFTNYSTSVNEADAFDTWVTPGEGTPGNYKWRMYVLPGTMSQHGLDQQLRPKHPMLWTKELKAGNQTTFATGKGGTKTTYGSGGWASGWTGSAKPESKLPLGTRIRCTQCGHWFRVDDLQGHVQCCPQVNQFSDWAIGCECCASMDDTATVKDGFPRPMYGTAAATDENSTDPVKADGEVSENGVGGEPAERPSGDPADAEGSVAAV